MLVFRKNVKKETRVRLSACLNVIYGLKTHLQFPLKRDVLAKASKRTVTTEGDRFYSIFFFRRTLASFYCSYQ